MPTDLLAPVDDGWFRKHATSYAAARAAAAAEAIDHAATTASLQVDNKSDGTNVYLDRPFYVYNLAYLAGATISAATLTIRKVSASNNDFSAHQVVVVGISGNPAAIVAGDWANVQFTALTDKPTISFTGSGDIVFTFSAPNTQLNKGGYFAIAVLFEGDRANSLTQGVGAYSSAVPGTQENATSTNRPVLSVTYTAPPPGQTVALTTATELDTAQDISAAVAPPQSVALTTAAELDTAIDLGSAVGGTPQSVALTTATETDTAQGITATLVRHTRAQGALAFLWSGIQPHAVALTTATETDTAQGIGVSLNTARIFNGGQAPFLRAYGGGRAEAPFITTGGGGIGSAPFLPSVPVG